MRVDKRRATAIWGPSVKSQTKTSGRVGEPKKGKGGGKERFEAIVLKWR